MPSADPAPLPSPAPLRELLDVARRSLEHGVRTDRPLEVDPAEYPPELRLVRSCFVTLRIDGRLRGCIGSLEASEPLVVDVAQNAFKAGFRDPRFAPLDAAELPRLDVEISLLTPFERLDVASEAALLAVLRPGIDGLVLRDGPQTATFLPAVWEQLPEPARFLRELQRKAGLPEGHWSDSLEVWRYSAEKIC
jgi:AmmeMemoRadiSam system protein A